MELNTLRGILGWDRTPEDDSVSVYVRRNRNVETVTSEKKSKLGRLDKTQFSAVCAWHESVVS